MKQNHYTCANCGPGQLSYQTTKHNGCANCGFLPPPRRRLTRADSRGSVQRVTRSVPAPDPVFGDSRYLDQSVVPRARQNPQVLRPTRTIHGGHGGRTRGVVDVFGAMSRSELADALAELAFKRAADLSARTTPSTTPSPRTISSGSSPAKAVTATTPSDCSSPARRRSQRSPRAARTCPIMDVPERDVDHRGADSRGRRPVQGRASSPSAAATRRSSTDCSTSATNWRCGATWTSRVRVTGSSRPRRSRRDALLITVSGSHTPVHLPGRSVLLHQSVLSPDAAHPVVGDEADRVRFGLYTDSGIY